MKSIISLIVCCATAVSVFAQTGNNTVTIRFNGQNRQVFIDGRAYESTANKQYATDNTAGATYNLMVLATDLRPGTHNLKVVRNNRNAANTNFTLRNNYDLDITVAGNGSIQLKETYRKRNVTTTTPSGNVAMSNANVNIIANEVKRKPQTAAKINTLQLAFSNPTNYFTTAQARKLIQLVNGESYRLQLAKTAVRGITDTRNIYGLTSLLASQAARNELNDYIRNYTTATTTSTGTTSPYRTPMADATFVTLYNNIRNMWQPGARLTAVSNAFAGSNNFFTTAQAIKLVLLLSSEAERLQLAKASYHTITDPSGFNQMSNVLGTQASKDELDYYVRTGGSNQQTTPVYNTAMTEANFNSLIEGIRVQWLPGAKKRDVLSAFANTSNYFSVNQAGQLIQLDNDEQDRLDMAKASLRSIVDPQNISSLNALFTSQAAKNEFAAYVSAYINSTGTSTGTTTTGTYRTPMSEANFTAMLNDTRSLWLPGAKKSAVINAFNTTGNYFTTNQAMQLIQLDNDESDRLDMAKASYKTLTDTQNFSQVYSLFTNQSYINELANYIRTIQ